LHQQQRAESPAGADNSAFIRAAQRLRDVVAYLDRELGQGYADAHPSLIAALAQTSAIDACADHLGFILDSLQDSLRSDHPLQGETFSGIAAALESIADGVGHVATQLKYLGTGDAATTMGAIEYLGTCIKQAADRLAGRDIAEEAPCP
jgi:hypothetical protein